MSLLLLEKLNWMLMCTDRVHVDQPARFLSRLLHPLETEARVHLVRELAALQPLEG